MALTNGTRIGPYEIVGLLGAGGMGEVYRARDSRLKREVAIKVLPADVAGDCERLARFQREAEVVASLSHPHIAQVYGIEDTTPGGGPSALIMELVDGEDLSQRIGRGVIPLDEALPIANQIAEALEAAHDAGIVHRDLKPANIKVTDGGAVKVLDFGLAKALDPRPPSSQMANSPTITSPAMTMRGVILGTAAYMSPEQAKGKAVDKRADIWAFGAVLYEMLAGTRAFPGEDVTDSIVSIMSRDPDWSKLPSNVPRAIRSMLARALDKDAKRRLRDIGEARVIIDDVLTGRVGDEAPTASQLRALPWWRRVMPAAVTAIVVGAIGYAAWSLKPSPPAPVVRFSVTMPDDFRFTRTSARMIDVSPDGSQIVYVGNRRLYLRSLASGEARVIAATNGLDPGTPIFSPDGQWVAFIAVTEQALMKVAVKGGAAIRLAAMNRGVGEFQGGAWHGDAIYFAQQGKGIMRISTNGGEPEVVAPVEASQFVYGPAFLPGGRSFLMAVTSMTTADRWELGEIVAFSPSTRERKSIMRGGGAPRYLPTGRLLYASGTTLLSVGFDPVKLEITGDPLPILENVRRAMSADSGASQFAVADNGTLAFIPDTPQGDPRMSTLMLAAIDGGGRPQPLPMPAGRYSVPRVSPDGRQFAVTLSGDLGPSIWIGGLDPPAPLRRLTPQNHERGAVWSLDSRTIFFDVPDGLFRQPADGSAPAERIYAGTTSEVEAVLPDGKSVAFAESKGILTISEGSKPQSLVARSGIQRGLSFSTDGRYFVYTSRSAGGPDLFVEPFPPNDAVIPLSTEGGTGARWSKTGTEIFYQLNARARGELSTVSAATLMRLRVRTSPTFAIAGAPAEVPNISIAASAFANFDITPDGKRVLFVAAAPTDDTPDRRPPEQIQVVVNWLKN